MRVSTALALGFPALAQNDQNARWCRGEAVRRGVCDAGFVQPVITRTHAAAGAGPFG